MLSEFFLKGSWKYFDFRWQRYSVTVYNTSSKEEASMGLQDSVTIFDRMDPAQKGFVTVDQLLDLHESVFYVPVAYDHVEAAVLLGLYNFANPYN